MTVAQNVCFVVEKLTLAVGKRSFSDEGGYSANTATTHSAVTTMLQIY